MNTKSIMNDYMFFKSIKMEPASYFFKKYPELAPLDRRTKKKMPPTPEFIEVTVPVKEILAIACCVQKLLTNELASIAKQSAENTGLSSIPYPDYSLPRKLHMLLKELVAGNLSIPDGSTFTMDGETSRCELYYNKFAQDPELRELGCKKGSMFSFMNTDTVKAIHLFMAGVVYTSPTAIEMAAHFPWLDELAGITDAIEMAFLNQEEEQHERTCWWAMNEAVKGIRIDGDHATVVLYNPDLVFSSNPDFSDYDFLDALTGEIPQDE